MTLKEQIMKLQTYKMFEGEDTVYVERDDVLKLLEQEHCETQMIDKSNFSQEQYKADLQSAYDCGKTSVKPCEDCISRADARHLIAEVNIKTLGYISAKVFKTLYNGVDELPPVTPQPKIGHWIHFAQSDDCSECRYSTGKYGSPSKYCPNCGTKMTEREG